VQTEVQGACARRPSAAMRMSMRGIRAGKPLSPELRGLLEDVFGCHLKQVRIHDGIQADSLNRELGSLALARGYDIFFRRGAFVPETPGGMWLLAHELAHVLQQRGSCRSHVDPRRARALEWEASAVAGAVLKGQRVVVPPRDGCPSTQLWDPDMHLMAVYWTGRMQGAEHTVAYRAALASESLDDDYSTAAPPMKFRATEMGLTDSPIGDVFRDVLHMYHSNHHMTVPNPYGGRLLNLSSSHLMRLANNSHALGVTYDQSEAVARQGINAQNDLIFGLGLHPVGDFLAHANLSAWPTWGHENGAGNDAPGTDSTMFDDFADTTSFNSSKALDTIARFTTLWADFLGTPPYFPSAQVRPILDFVLTYDFNKKIDAFKKAGYSSGDTKDLIDLFNLDASDRHQLWLNGSTLVNGNGSWSEERRVANRVAGSTWLSFTNDHLLRMWREDVSRALNLWRDLGQSYPSLPPPPPRSTRYPKL